jgi:NAD(P)-dependent dehydrogenase (short-subunit alcohol dehydrogenase family)
MAVSRSRDGLRTGPGLRIAVVTGASHGIGREIAMTLAERGFAVRGIGLYARDIAATHEEAKRRSLDVQVYEGDVSRSPEVAKFRRWVENAGGQLSAICNNAAIRPSGTVLTTSEEEWDRVFAVNVKGAFLILRAFLPALVAAGGGSIVNVASCSAMGAANLVAYSSSKSALIAMTRCLAEDHKADRIRANVILPGPIRSGMTSVLPNDLLVWCERNGVAGRLGQPRDVANAVAFLVSDEAETISGTELRVNYWPALFA